MTERLSVRPLGPHEYAVTVTEGENTTHHRVRVPEQLLDDLALAGTDEEQLVDQSFRFLLDREPASAILPEFDLDVIGRYFPDYPRELAARLTGRPDAAPG